MGLLAPLFLAGAFLIALPIWLHRLQTKSSNRQPFSSAMLLESTDEQVHVQKKLKYLLLLALRIAVLLILALAFAKPFMESTPDAAPATGAGSHLVVVDTSVSMGRSGVFGQALEQARSAIDDAPRGAALQLVAAGGSVRLLGSPSTDRAAPRASLTTLEPSAERLDFGRLAGELERLAQSLPAPVTVHLISDFQESAMPVQFADVVPAGVATLVPHVVGTGDPVNWSISAVRETADGIDVIVSNEGLPDRTADVRLRQNGALIGMQTASGSGQYRLRFADINLEEGDNRFGVTLDTDDDLAADNRWYTVISNDPPLPVPLITANPSGLPMTYLSAALASATDLNFEILPLTVGDFDARVLTRYRWAIVDDLGAVDPLLEQALAEFIGNGGNLLAFAGERSVQGETLPVAAFELAPASVGSTLGEFLRVDSFDAQHPALAGTDGWHRVSVSRSVAIELADTDDVLMRLEGGDPFIVERRLGDGRVVTVLSGLDNRWNDLPVHPVFVGFMIEAAEYLSGRVARNVNYTTGDSVTLARRGSLGGQVVDPDGDTVLSLADTADARTIRLDKPGIYTVYTAEGEALIAANIDPLESALTRISQSVLDRWQDATYSSDTAAAPTSAVIGAEPLELWPWLLLLLAVFAIAESALGNVHIAMKTRTSQ